MEFENIGKLNKEDHTDDNLNLRQIIEKYLRYWKWFLLALFLSIIFSYLYLNFQRNLYEASMVIKIKNAQGTDRNALSAFQDLGLMSPANQNLEDEREVLLSKDLISEVIKSLKFNISFYADKNYLSQFLDDNLSFSTEFYKNLRYDQPPVEINFLFSDSILFQTRTQFFISVKSPNYFIFTDNETRSEQKYEFGKKFKTNFGDIIITPNANLEIGDLIGSNFMVVISPVDRLATNFANKLVIEPKSEYSSILSLKITSSNKHKAENFLSQLVKTYNERTISIKEELSKSTSDFVNKRLELISKELTVVDLTAETLKTRYGLSDAASETGLNMQSGQVIENQIVQASTELEKIGFIKDFVTTKDENELIPVNIGVADNNVSSTIQQYNQLMMQKKKLLENSTEKNPIVVNLNEQLRTLKLNIEQGLANIKSSQQISLDALTKQDLRINSRLFSAPKQERQYRDIQRQQQIKESLYLYLLEKREETALTLGVADPNAIIIDSPRSSPNRVAPKKTVTLIGFLIIGLIIPIAIIYLTELLDTKIHSREDVEKVLNIPIIGDIPLLPSKKPYLIKKDDYSSAAEAFRILRTNLNFILQMTKNKKAKIIFITSTIAHEGKSLVTSNLAAALAHGGKRTLIMGMDIRAPKLHTYLGLKGDIGVTNFIINSDISVDDITVKAPNIENLFIISSGDIAPNPAELLMNPRIKEIFSIVKENYDYVIVDTAAFSMVTDTLLLSSFADVFIYTIRANFLDKRLLKYINNIYKEKRLPNMALLINGVDHKKSYGYGYGYGYGKDFDKSQKKKWWKFS